MNTTEIIPARIGILILLLCAIFGCIVGGAFNNVTLGIACFAGLFTLIAAIALIVQGAVDCIRIRMTELQTAKSSEN